MTSKVTVEAMSSDVWVVVNDAMDRDDFVIKDGDKAEFHVYDDISITVREIHGKNDSNN